MRRLLLSIFYIEYDLCVSSGYLFNWGTNQLHKLSFRLWMPIHDAFSKSFVWHWHVFCRRPDEVRLSSIIIIVVVLIAIEYIVVCSWLNANLLFIYDRVTYSCTSCPAGKSCNVVGTVITSCAVGSYAVYGSGVCTICHAGNSCPYTDQAVEIPCTPGTYAIAGRSSWSVFYNFNVTVNIVGNESYHCFVDQMFIALTARLDTRVQVSRLQPKPSAQTGPTVSALKLSARLVPLATHVRPPSPVRKYHAALVTTPLEGKLHVSFVPLDLTVPTPHRLLLSAHKELTLPPLHRQHVFQPRQGFMSHLVVHHKLQYVTQGPTVLEEHLFALSAQLAFCAQLVRQFRIHLVRNVLKASIRLTL